MKFLIPNLLVVASAFAADGHSENMVDGLDVKLVSVLLVSDAANVSLDDLQVTLNFEAVNRSRSDLFFRVVGMSQPLKWSDISVGAGGALQEISPYSMSVSGDKEMGMSKNFTFLQGVDGDYRNSLSSGNGGAEKTECFSVTSRIFQQEGYKYHPTILERKLSAYSQIKLAGRILFITRKISSDNFEAVTYSFDVIGERQADGKFKMVVGERTPALEIMKF